MSFVATSVILLLFVIIATGIVIGIVRPSGSENHVGATGPTGTGYAPTISASLLYLNNPDISDQGMAFPANQNTPLIFSQISAVSTGTNVNSAIMDFYYNSGGQGIRVTNPLPKQDIVISGSIDLTVQTRGLTGTFPYGFGAAATTGGSLVPLSQMVGLFQNNQVIITTLSSTFSYTLGPSLSCNFIPYVGLSGPMGPGHVVVNSCSMVLSVL